MGAAFAGARFATGAAFAGAAFAGPAFAGPAFAVGVEAGAFVAGADFFAAVDFAAVRALRRVLTVVVAAALAAAAALTVAALVVAAFAEADRAPVTATAAALTAVERAVRVEEPAGRGVADRVVAADRARDCRWVGTAGAAVVAASALPRLAAGAVRALDAGPGTGSDPSMGRWPWWRELIHLTSVDRHDSAFPGRGAGSM